MTTEEKLTKNKLGLLKLAEPLRNVSSSLPHHGLLMHAVEAALNLVFA